MLAELPEIDAVSVCTWNAAHAECTIAALNAGKHVLCEKPMAMNAAEAQAMLDAAKRNDRLLMIGFVRRFGNDCAIAKDLIEHDRMGDIYYAKATYLRRNGCPGGWFGDKARSGGGPLIDLGVHVIDLTRYLMGKPKPVSVYGATFHKLGDRRSIKSERGYVSATQEDGRARLQRGGSGQRHDPLRQRRGAAGGSQLQPEPGEGHRHHRALRRQGRPAAGPRADLLRRNGRLHDQRHAGRQDRAELRRPVRQ